MAEQEGAFVEPFAPQPAGDFVVALAGVAGPAGGRDVVEGVPAAAGQRLHAVTLQRRTGGAAVRAATPSLLQRGPLVAAEVVFHAGHPAFTSARTPGLGAPVDGHASA